MDANPELSVNSELDSCPAECDVLGDNINNTESNDIVTPNVELDNPSSPPESRICPNLINEEQYQCSEVIDACEQSQLLCSISDSNQLVSNQIEEDVEPNIELPCNENFEEILKSNEVLLICNRERNSLKRTLQSSPEESNKNADVEECLTRECTVSLPNIDELLSQNAENGRTDVSLFTDSSTRTSDDDPTPSNLWHQDQNSSSNKALQDEILANNRPPCSGEADDNNRIEINSLTDYNADTSNFDFDANNKSNLKRPFCSVESSVTPHKKSKKGITFDSVSVYYFPRTQGFTCIPSQGGSTLGMSWNHSHSRKFSLGEHAAEQRRAHRQFCSQQFSNSRNWNEMSTISSEDSDSDEIVSDSEMDCENYNFLQPIPTRERRAMLRAAGINKIDSTEKDECRSIRLSREFCGCTCQVYCDPERCVCAQAGIKCQVDRMNFPCSCTREGCANENGRIEFNPVRVRTHYIHTLMRLEMEKKKEEEEQRNKLIINNIESNSQLSYSPSLDLGGNNLMNFSYHNDLQSYYAQPPISYASTTNSVVNSCFNFTYASNDQFVIPSTAASIAYHESITNTSMRLGNGNTSQMDYCCTLNTSTDCLRSNEFSNGSLKEQDSQNFVIRDLTNGSENNDNNVPYASESFMQLANDNFDQQVETANPDENLDTSVEASEETEKEESDSENFGNIIKKTMVESVIA